MIKWSSAHLARVVRDAEALVGRLFGLDVRLVLLRVLEDAVVVGEHLGAGAGAGAG